MSDPIRAALERLVAADRFLGVAGPEYVQAREAARAALAAQPEATTDPDTDAVLRLAAILREVNSPHVLGAAAMAEAILSHPAACAVLAAAAADHFPDARKMVTPPPSLSQLVQPSGGYRLGTGNEDGAQLVHTTSNGTEWWVPEFGCDSLDATLDAIRYRVAPYLREPVAGVDVPGPDGDYGGLTELCQAQGVAPELGVPLLQRAAKAWGRSAAPTPPADGEAEIPEEVRAAFAELNRREENLRRFRQLRSDLGATSPTPPAGEVEELAEWLERLADRPKDSPCAAASFDGHLRRAAALLREAHPQPVPVAERPWEREGWCDEQGRCWWGRCADEFSNPDWHFATRSEVEEFCSDLMPELSLPHWAISIPTTTETTDG